MDNRGFRKFLRDGFNAEADFMESIRGSVKDREASLDSIRYAFRKAWAEAWKSSQTSRAEYIEKDEAELLLKAWEGVCGIEGCREHIEELGGFVVCHTTGCHAVLPVPLMRYVNLRDIPPDEGGPEFDPLCPKCYGKYAQT